MKVLSKMNKKHEERGFGADALNHHVCANNEKPLLSLGWSQRFQQQLSFEELEQTCPHRVVAVHRGQVILSDGEKEQTLSITGKLLNEREEEHITIGDWILLSRDTGNFIRLLERFSLIQRQSAGTDKSQQLVAANVDTMFIVSSCNADFNLSRLERYLTIAHASKVYPVIALTKQDLSNDPQSYLESARSLGAGIIVETVNALDPTTMTGLLDWCRPGQTVALVGSSGVGKTTLANTLGAKPQKTGSIREDDAKGRHTTTHRSLHPLSNGAVLLDSPGMRELGLADASAGVATVFEEIDALSRQCRFSNCQHDQEPGCAVRAAIEKQELSERRLTNYAKLMAEQERNAASIAERRRKDKATTKFYKSVMAGKKSRKRF